MSRSRRDTGSLLSDSQGYHVPERDFLQAVRDYARLMGWADYHTWHSLHSPSGFPDLVLVRPPRVIFAELKSEKGQVSSSQEVWLKLLQNCPGVECYLWRPSDWEQIVRILKR